MIKQTLGTALLIASIGAYADNAIPEQLNSTYVNQCYTFINQRLSQAEQHQFSNNTQRTPPSFGLPGTKIPGSFVYPAAQQAAPFLVYCFKHVSQVCGLPKFQSLLGKSTNQCARMLRTASFTANAYAQKTTFKSAPPQSQSTQQSNHMKSTLQPPQPAATQPQATPVAPTTPPATPSNNQQKTNTNNKNNAQGIQW